MVDVAGVELLFQPAYVIPELAGGMAPISKSAKSVLGVALLELAALRVAPEK